MKIPIKIYYHYSINHILFKLLFAVISIPLFETPIFGLIFSGYSLYLIIDILLTNYFKHSYIYVNQKYIEYRGNLRHFKISTKDILDYQIYRTSRPVNIMLAFSLKNQPTSFLKRLMYLNNTYIFNGVFYYPTISILNLPSEYHTILSILINSVI